MTIRSILGALCALLPALASAAPEITGLRTATMPAGASTTLTVENFAVPSFSGPQSIYIGACTTAQAVPAIVSATWGSENGAQINATYVNSTWKQSSIVWSIPNVPAGTHDLTVTLNGEYTLALIAGVIRGVGPVEESAVATATGAGPISSPIITESQDAYVLAMACANHQSAALAPTGPGQTSVQSYVATPQSALLTQAAGPTVPGTLTSGFSWATFSSPRIAVVTASFPKEATACAGCDWIPQDTLMIRMGNNPYPQCQGVVDDGTTDVTAAINACLTYWGPTGIFAPGSSDRKETLYFPHVSTGVYRLTAQVRAAVEEDRLSFLCDPGVKFKLDDNAPGFGDQCAPQGLFYAGNPNGGNATAFDNNFTNCEIDLGNNPGADGLDWVVNNVGAIADNYIHGTAFNRGINLTRAITGPMIVRNNRIEGGRYGIDIGKKYMSVVLEGNSTSGQSIEGVRISENGVAVVNHESVQTNGRPAIHLSQGFWMTHANIIGGTFENSGGSNSAAIVIDDGTGTQARAFARGIDAAGYTLALKRGANSISSPLSEWVSHPVHTLFTSAPTSLNLPLPNHPHRIHPNATDWVNLCALTTCDGVVNNTATLQGLINDPNGPKVIYASGIVSFSQIDIPPASRLERIACLDCGFYAAAGAVGPWITSRSNIGVEFDRFSIKSSAPVPRIRQAGSGPVIITDSNIGGTVDCVPGSGPMHVENIITGQLTTCGNDLTFHQLNIEATAGVSTPKLTCDGGTCAGAGFKTENRGGSELQAACLNGAQCEIFTGFHLGASTLASSTQPLYLCSESDCAFSYATTVDNPINPIQVRAVRNSVTADLNKSVTANRGQGEGVALFVERP